jgi:hypothetical protein
MEGRSKFHMIYISCKTRMKLQQMKKIMRMERRRRKMKPMERKKKEKRSRRQRSKRSVFFGKVQKLQVEINSQIVFAKSFSLLFFT